MANLTGTQEKAIREAIKVLILNQTFAPGTTDKLLPGNFPVFTSPQWINSDIDYVNKFAREFVAGQKKELRYIWIQRANFTNDETEGCDDEPLILLNYTIRVFFQFLPRPAELPEIETEFVDLIFALRSMFLKFPNAATGQIKETDSFTAPEIEQFGVDDVTGATGFFQDFSLEVKHYAE